ncbi:MAG: Mrp/NBP35 family ATP-binding protein [Clostridia bacterium]|nr:Mrp/NBP35 family ATP-binding protein [Clostridia bacterium]
MSECSGNCSSCSSADCKDRDPILKQNAQSNIKKIYAVVSGKGGVGKSSVTCQIAAAMQKKGKNVAVLDADVTGPSVPKMFGIKDKAYAEDKLLLPAVSKNGTKIMSVNLLLETDETPVVWRGPVISGVIQQFFTEVKWGDVDYMFVDMPPGTGDVALTVFQNLKVDGIIVVTTPQDLVSMIVAKAVNMAKLMNIPIVGIVENMSYFECDDCGKKHFIFGESKIAEVAEKNGLAVLATLPIDPKTPGLADSGNIEDADSVLFTNVINALSE